MSTCCYYDKDLKAGFIPVFYIPPRWLARGCSLPQASAGNRPSMERTSQEDMAWAMGKHGGGGGETLKHNLATM